MTREHKLAIILGFAIVLVVTIVISDHFSKANTAELVGETEVALEPEGPIGRDPFESQPPTIVFQDPETGRFVESKPEPLDSIAAMQAEGEADGGGEAMAQSDDSHVFEEILNGLRDLPAAAQTETRMSAKQPVPSVITMGEPVARPGPGDADASEPVRTHTVREGETLWSIAERYYGDGSMHRQLAEYNRHVVGDGRTLSVGMRLEVPGRQRLLTGRPSDVRASWGSEPVVREPAPESSDRAYTVRPGDTLSEIAQKQCGTVRMMDEILALNSDQLDDADSIRVGMVLRLPPR